MDIVTKEDVMNGLYEIVEFQTKETWRRENWQVNTNTLVNLEGFENSKGNWENSEISKSDVLLSISDKLIDRKYLLIQQLSSEMDYSGQIPVTIGLANGKDIKGLFSADNLSNSYVYGPSLAIENDTGYDAGTQYLLDVTDVSKANLKSLLQSAREKLDDMQEQVYSYLEGANRSDDDYDHGSFYNNRRYEGYDDEFNNLYDRDDDYSDVRSKGTSSEASDEFIDKAVKAVIVSAYNNDAKSPYITMEQEFARAVNIDLDKFIASKKKISKEAQKVAETQKVVSKEQPSLETTSKVATKSTVKNVTVQKATYKKPISKTVETKTVSKPTMSKSNTVVKSTQETVVAKTQPKVEPAKSTVVQTVKNQQSKDKADDKGVVIFIKPGIAKAVREKGPNGKPMTKEFTIEGYSDERIKNGIIRFAVNDAKNNVTAKQLYTSPKFRNWTVVNGQENSTVTVTYETKMNHSTAVREESLDIYKFQAWVKERNKEQVKTVTKSGVTTGNAGTASGRGE